jgi:hypothetical protein
MMRRSAFIALISAYSLAGCGGDDQSPVAIPASYEITPPATELRVGQDSLLSLYGAGVRVVRDGTDTINGPNTTTQPLPRMSYFIGDLSIAYIDYNSGGEYGFIRGIKGGTTTITIVGYGEELTLPLTVTPYPATSVTIRILSGPAGGLISLANRRDTGTFYALPADRLSSRVEGLALVNSDTVFCNYCPIKTPARVHRRVIWSTTNPAIAIVSNAANPTSQRASGSTLIHVDTVGFVTAFDTSSTPVGIIMGLPGDGLADTAWVKFALRPIDTLRVMPDSLDVPAEDIDDIGTDRVAYPGNELLGIATQSASTNYRVRVEYQAFVRSLPTPPSTSAQNPRTLSIRNTGGVTVFRPNVPIVVWESALDSYLQINTAGSIVGPCAFINASPCLAPSSRPGASQNLQRALDSLVIQCVDNGRRLPGTNTNGTPVGPGIQFGGDGILSIPGCPNVGNAPGPNIPMPGAFCTSASSTNLSSTCTIWVRARATDHATGKALEDRFRVEVRR